MLAPLPHRSPIATRTRAATAWDVDFTVAHRGHVYRASRLTATELTFVSSTPIAPNWLTDIEVRYFLEPICILVNVISCEPSGNRFQITVRPFALGGVAKTAWLQMLASTRPSA